MDGGARRPAGPMNMPPAKRFEDLLVWRKAHRFVLDVYHLSGGFPKGETYGLTAQIRRAAVSIAANISEGFKRQTKREKVRFLNIAQGSAEETRYYLILARDLGYADSTALMADLDTVTKLLEMYKKRIRESIGEG